MEQDLFDWLNSQQNKQNEEINSIGTGLILAPLSVVPETLPENEHALEPENQFPDYPQNFHEDDSASTDSESDESDSQLIIPESVQAIPDYPLENQADDSESEPPQEQEQEQEQKQEDLEILEDHEWQERATGFTLSLDEPPPELWTKINDDDEEPEYEETDSLQGAAYIPLHGRNFTERLHHTLRHRKERAVQRAEAEKAERESESTHAYLQKTVIYCMTLIMALGFAFLALWFIGRETPQGMRERAERLISAGNFEEAEQIYMKAYRRYPEDKFFIEAVSKTAEKAGHVQTAKAAHDEYIRRTSPDVPPEVKPAPKALIVQEKPLTFNDYINEANHAYNIGMYNRSLIYFFRAHKASPNDLRPYIGLSNAYRMKGMYFDSKRILDEAQSKFRRNPDIEMGYEFLREVK